MCRQCLDCQCYSDNNWIVEVERIADGKLVQICTGSFDGCLQKAAYKDAYAVKKEGARGDESSESDESGSDREEKRKEARRELADLLA
jgi:hypothetical protein